MLVRTLNHTYEVDLERLFIRRADEPKWWKCTVITPPQVGKPMFAAYSGSGKFMLTTNVQYVRDTEEELNLTWEIVR